MNWTILALMLMIPGAVGLGWGTMQNRQAARRIVQAAGTIEQAPSADEYLAMYAQWSQLSPAEKAENPWGQGPYGGADIQKRLREHQQPRLEADLPDLDAGLKTYPPQLADVLYGPGWEQRLADFQRAREIRNLVTTASGILLFAGGLLFCGGLVRYAVVRVLYKEQTEQMSEEIQAFEDTEMNNKGVKEPAGKGSDRPSASAMAQTPDAPVKPAVKSADSCGYFESTENHQKQAVKSAMSTPMPAAQPSGDFAASVSLVDSSSAPQSRSYFGWEMDTQEEDPAISTLMTTHPVTHELTELTEEVSAIRQYAAAQQDQIRKFQDGYDWMIIRRFCMRIIRCIDNLDDRLAKLDPEEQTLQGCLEDIRDELIFALESSGVEQFSPDVKTPFKGLEKYVEAVHQRVPVSNADWAGTIAEIVRPGYQYLINDDEVKIVRCAQVKLYDAAETEA